MNISEFDYQLPPEYIAQVPIEPRDQSRMMIVDRNDGSLEHSFFYHLPDLIKEGDTLVFNNSRVIPARLYCRKKGSTIKIELLLLRRIEGSIWESMVRPGRKIMPGDILYAGNEDGQPDIEILERREAGLRIIRLADDSIVERYGHVPLPPYIHAPLQQAERYQTVYSDVKGSVAAPTAGLHFTPEMLENVTNKGVNIAFVTLHIGLDTFRPIHVEDPAQHEIHTEYGEVSEKTAAVINETKKKGGRIIAVGTSTVRLIEAASQGGVTKPLTDQIKLFIMPGYKFQIVDGMITNFHLPRSTLLLMVSAFASREIILGAYEQAKQTGYRFYSFGDCMFIR